MNSSTSGRARRAERRHGGVIVVEKNTLDGRSSAARRRLRALTEAAPRSAEPTTGPALSAIVASAATVNAQAAADREQCRARARRCQVLDAEVHREVGETRRSRRTGTSTLANALPSTIVPNANQGTQRQRDRASARTSPSAGGGGGAGAIASVPGRPGGGAGRGIVHRARIVAGTDTLPDSRGGTPAPEPRHRITCRQAGTRPTGQGLSRQLLACRANMKPTLENAV